MFLMCSMGFTKNNHIGAIDTLVEKNLCALCVYVFQKIYNHIGTLVK
jgi:hypothetical protein